MCFRPYSEHLRLFLWRLYLINVRMHAIIKNDFPTNFLVFSMCIGGTDVFLHQDTGWIIKQSSI